MQHDDNLTADLPSFVTHLECAMTGERHEADQVHNLSRAGKPLLVRYDLEGIRKALSKETLAKRAPDLWRYRELLPVRKTENIVSLGETMTPIVAMPRFRKSSAAVKSWSRTKADCRPARSRRAVWSWPFLWPRRSA